MEYSTQRDGSSTIKINNKKGTNLCNVFLGGRTPIWSQAGWNPVTGKTIGTLESKRTILWVSKNLANGNYNYDKTLMGTINVWKMLKDKFPNFNIEMVLNKKFKDDYELYKKLGEKKFLRYQALLQEI